jgi:hypothetical protein
MPANDAMPKGPIALAVVIITVGVGWLLSVQGIGQGIDWIWTLGLAVVGIGAFVASGGVDKTSVVLGPFFLAASILSVLRQTGKLSLNTELPIIVILLGLLLLLAQMPFIPPPKWHRPAKEENSG